VKRSIWIFLIAILLPSIGLGWLALRSAGEQQIILERRTAELYQKETDAVAAAARALIDDERRAFAQTVRSMIAAGGAPQLARDFSAKLAQTWPRKAIGFAIAEDGSLASPSADGARANTAWQTFLLNNSAFLSGRIPATVYSVSADELSRPEQLRNSKSTDYTSATTEQEAPAAAPAPHRLCRRRWTLHRDQRAPRRKPRAHAREKKFSRSSRRNPATSPRNDCPSRPSPSHARN
jgi:hypothetical protein